MKPTARLFPWIVVFVCSLPAIPVRAQNTPPTSEVDAIRKEMEHLRRDYEERIRKLEDRLKAVETARPATTPAAPPPTVPVVAATPGTAVPSTAGASACRWRPGGEVDFAPRPCSLA